MRRTASALALLGVFLAGWAVLRAQTSIPSGRTSPDIMPALLEEVRGLRAALEQMGSAGPRVQLALGRLQLQEQRLNVAVKRLDEVHTRLAETQRKQADSSFNVASMDRALKEGNWGRSEAGAPSAEEMEQVLTARRRELAQINAELQRLAAEESGLATEVTNEQARWIELNQRLEDLERALRPLK